MVKHPAWAAAINSSGLVPFSFWKRVLKEYGVSESTPESVERLPLPARPVPRQTAFALRIMNVSSLRIFRTRSVKPESGSSPSVGETANHHGVERIHINPVAHHVRSLGFVPLRLQREHRCLFIGIGRALESHDLVDDEQLGLMDAARSCCA